VATYLLTWNPDRWEWTDLASMVESIARGEPARERWSTGTRTDLAPGSRVFLLRQGVEPRGIVGAGFTTSPVYDGPHYDAARAAAGDTAHYTMVEFDSLVDVATDPPLARDALDAPPLGKFRWDVQGSGVEIDPDTASALENAWAKHLGSVGSARFMHREQALARSLGDFIDAPTYLEGAKQKVTVDRRERDPAARTACIAHHGCSCVVCGFNFRDKYGALGDGFIHVHHLDPLGQAAAERAVDPVNDLVPVCPNCHAMLHRREPLLTIAELRGILSHG
jgi:5-methylcytosine-specific restriction enzyme A